MDFTKYLVYALVAAAGFTAGTMYQKDKDEKLSANKTETIHLCATLKESPIELVLESSVTLHTEEGKVLAVLAPDQVENVLKDERLAFHACK